jgi:tetratricopeptide (TPR) repeat protein
MLEQAVKWRTFNVVRSLWLERRGTGDTPSTRPVLSEEVQALLDYRGGLEKYERDPAGRDAVVRHFHFNLRRMISMCRRRDVRVWLVDPVCNLSDIPPFKAAHRDHLPPEDVAEWDRLRELARTAYPSDLKQAIRMLQHAAQIDDQHAGLHYDLGKCHESLGEYGAARDAYLRAKDLDLCPLRIIEPLRDALLHVARETRTPVIPVRARFEQQCPHGIPGGYLLVDHVHPSISGHQMIASWILEEMVRHRLVDPTPNWASRRDALYQAHTQSLGDKYYLQGQRRLEGLRKWAQGRATLAPPQPGDPPPRPVE